MPIKSRKGKSFVTIMLFIAVTAFLLRVVIDRVIKLNIAQNESSAIATLKLIGASLESYANNNRGAYPASFNLLTSPKPPFLDKDYIALSPVKGYNYGCSVLESGGYSCFAMPDKCRLTGNLAYIINTGALLVTQECEKKE